jgi:polyferredoxin
VLLGRGFCISICPYAMLQNVLFDNDTLVIEYDVSRDAACMKCDACVQVCPVGIDIKKGLNSACIACAECIDACRSITEKRGMSPFPNYKGRTLRPKTFWIGGTTAAAAIILFLLIWSRPPVDFLVTRDNALLPPGLNRYSYTIYNNDGKTHTLELSSPDRVTLIGEHTLLLQPFSAVHGSILVRSTGRLEHFHLTISGEGISLNRETVFL